MHVYCSMQCLVICYVCKCECLNSFFNKNIHCNLLHLIEIGNKMLQSSQSESPTYIYRPCIVDIVP